MRFIGVTFKEIVELPLLEYVVPVIVFTLVRKVGSGLYKT